MMYKSVRKIMADERGSLTVEATIALVVYLLAIISFINLIYGVGVHSHINGAMYVSAYEISQEAKPERIDDEWDDYEDEDELDSKEEEVKEQINEDKLKEVSDKEEGDKADGQKITVGYATNRVKSKVDNNYLQKMPLEGGMEGMSIVPEVTGEYNDMLTLNTYTKLEVPLLGVITSVDIGQEMKCRLFSGNGATKSGKRFVYVTEKGSVYHTNIECTYLVIKKQKVKLNEVDSLRNTSGGKYELCKECDDVGVKDGNVYVTSYGTSYHCDITCSTINRTILPIDIAEIDGRKKCDKCVGRKR